MTMLQLQAWTVALWMVLFADIYVEEFDKHVDETEVHTEASIKEQIEKWEIEESTNDVNLQGLVTTDVGETYSRHRGTRMPLIPMQFV